MCRSPHTYCIHSNLVNWSASYAIAAVINYLSREPHLLDDYTSTWVAGASWGFLTMWAVEMGREWVKSRLPRT
jgi:hypothetical protein